MKKYCQKCGAPTEYTLTKPKYCSKCGESFDLVNESKSIKKILEPENDQFIEDCLTENSDIYKNIKVLEFEEVSSSKLKGEKLEDIIKQGSLPQKKNKRKRNKILKSETDRILEETLNEAKTLRPKK